jgi:hypothetical protein
MTDWWTGYDPTQTTIDCGDGTHRLRWEAGELHALDHDDAPGERTLAALGGERNACIDLVDAWHRHADDLRVLTLASRGPSDMLAPQPPPPGFPGAAPRSRRASGLGRSYAIMRSVVASGGGTFGVPAMPPSPVDDLITLLTLPGALPDRLAITVAATWTRRLTDQKASEANKRPQLYAALWGRVTATLRAWLGTPTLDPELELINANDDPSLASRDGSVRARLPFSWLVDVWGRGLGTISGRFCIAVEADAAKLRLLTIGPDFGATRAITIEVEPPR